MSHFNNEESLIDTKISYFTEVVYQDINEFEEELIECIKRLCDHLRGSVKDMEKNLCGASNDIALNYKMLHQKTETLKSIENIFVNFKNNSELGFRMNYESDGNLYFQVLNLDYYYILFYFYTVSTPKLRKINNDLQFSVSAKKSENNNDDDEDKENMKLF